MKDKTVTQIVDELEGLFEATGISATQVLGAMLNAPVPIKFQKLARLGYTAGWRSIFKSKPEPTKVQLAEILTTIGALKGAPYKLKALFKQNLKKMPHLPGGPPRKVKPEDERTVCGEVLKLKAVCDTREAIMRVASKRQVSARTIYRIWGKYYPKKKKRQIVTKSKE